MATGDQSDVLSRLKAVLPNWFGTSSPILDAVLSGVAQTSAFIYALYGYAKLQTRILTASDGWLDMIAADFFGSSIVRKPNQADASFRTTIIVNLLRERATRAAIVKVMLAISGQTPKIVEPMRPADTGAYSAPNSGYSVSGGYGSMLIPFQAFVTAYRPVSSGIPMVAGYGVTSAAYGTPSQGGEYASLSMVLNSIQDADIYAAIDAVKPAATALWVTIQNSAPVYGALDSTFVLDSTQLA